MPVVVLEHDSPALRANPLGDPHVRKLHVIVPEGLDPEQPLPCVWYLAGYAGVGRGQLTDDPWQEGLEERVARLMREGRLGPMLVALPDCFTRFGGCQYLSSPAVGDYEGYLLSELRAAVEARWRVSAHGIAGKSSGGFGALVHAMRHPQLFRAVACHSGDMGFELSVFPELVPLMNALRDHGGVEAFVEAFARTPKKKEGRWFAPMSALALAAVYSPSPEAPLGIGLPFDLQRGTLDEAMLDRWRAWDPVRMVERAECQRALSAMKLVYVDCGRRDEHGLHWGALALHARLSELGVPHEYEDFDDGHRNTSYRLDVSLPRLYRALEGRAD
jgi:S-formylglutathione hydrolase FrmB